MRYLLKLTFIFKCTIQCVFSEYIFVIHTFNMKRNSLKFVNRLWKNPECQQSPFSVQLEYHDGKSMEKLKQMLWGRYPCGVVKSAIKLQEISQMYLNVLPLPNVLRRTIIKARFRVVSGHVSADKSAQSDMLNISLVSCGAQLCPELIWTFGTNPCPKSSTVAWFSGVIKQRREPVWWRAAGSDQVRRLKCLDEGVTVSHAQYFFPPPLFPSPPPLQDANVIGEKKNHPSVVW